MKKLVVIFLLFTILACIKKNKDRNNFFSQKLIEIDSINIGKDLSLIGEIIDNPEVTFTCSKKLIFLVADGDCSVCIDKGYDLFAHVAEEKKYYCAIISAGLDLEFLQNKYGFKNYLFNDNEDLLRKKLSYSYTPILLVLDEDNKVEYALITNYRSLSNQKIEEFKNNYY